MFSKALTVRSLLRDDVGAGYPPAYVLARVRGRRSVLAADQGRTIDSTVDEQIWNAFLGELTWLFRQMDRRLRDAHAPIFALFEMKTIVLCLRNASLGRAAAQRQLVARSLLAPRLRQILAEPEPVGAIVAALGDEMGTLSRAFFDLDTRYFEAGLKGCEDALMRMYLESLASARVRPPVRLFLSRFTDLRNLMALYKHLHWRLTGPVVLIRGGSIDVSAFKQAVIHDDHAALAALAQRATGVPTTAADEIGLETRLLAALSDALRRARRERGGEWAIADYMWSIYVSARNRAVRHHGAGLEPAVVEREIA